VSLSSLGDGAASALWVEESAVQVRDALADGRNLGQGVIQGAHASHLG
jgi:hypothetical protein